MQICFIGVLLFAAQRCFEPDVRTVRVPPGLQAELIRRFKDTHGRTPTAAERATSLAQWKREEALVREALRLRLDRDDPAIRQVLIEKMHSLAGLEAPSRSPTEDELRAFLWTHRGDYELPLRYDFEFLQFSKPEARELLAAERALGEGRSPSALGRPLLGGNLTLVAMKERVPAALVAILPRLRVAQWQTVESEQGKLLVRVKGTSGGLPAWHELRPRLAADWSFAQKQDYIQQALQRTVDRYQFESLP